MFTDLIDEDDGGLELDSQGEDGGGQLLGLAVPLVSQCGGLQVDEAEPGLLGGGFGDQGLTTTRGAIQKHTLKGNTNGLGPLCHSGSLFSHLVTFFPRMVVLNPCPWSLLCFLPLFSLHT